MAKSKKKPARKTSRRRVSGAGSGIIGKVGGALVGAIAGRMLAQKLMPNLDEKIKGAAIAAAGVFLVPRLIKGPMGEGLSIGLAVAGGTQVLQGTGLIAGINSPVMYLPASRVAGSDGISAQVAGGSGISAQVAGYKTEMRKKAEG